MSTTPKLPDEMELIKILKNSDACRKFRSLQLSHKINREQQAWNLICKNRGKYSEDILSQIFDILDTPAKTENNKKVRPWFGQTFNKPNRKNIFKYPINHINDWIETLLFSNISPDKALNICLHDINIKVKGANKGITTIFLYLSSPSQYNIWLNKPEKGLVNLNYIDGFKKDDHGSYYMRFNNAAIIFREKHGFRPQEIDWILTFIPTYRDNKNSIYTYY